MEFPDRHTVLVIGDFKLDKRPFTERGDELYPVTVEDAPKYFNLAKGLIVAGLPGQFSVLRECGAKIFPHAEDHGLVLATIVHSDEEIAQADSIQKSFKGTSCSRIFVLSALGNAAEFIARHRIAPSPGTLQIDPPTAKLDDEDRLLLHRAFYDCDRIYLEPIGGGKASMSVFRVHAWMKQSEVGPLPLPFFAKIAKPSEVDTEKFNYRMYAESYIPFNLRPNIDRRRCVATRAKAALIGNFVDDAVPLRKALQSGHGIGSVFSLFETTLKNFRLQPFASGKKPETGWLERFATGRIKLDELAAKSKVVARAQALGLTATPQELNDRIAAAARPLACIIGPNHGDLHTGNVMVRGGDAILIDFGSASHGPLTADPATLEVSLMFGTDSWETENDFTEWQQFIDEIYPTNAMNLRPPALFENKPGSSSWLRRSLRELRHVLLACEGSSMEAQVMLAAYLMRYARLDIETLDEDSAKTLAFDRHCYSLVVAERIVKGFTIEAPNEGAAA
jgi:hypothetical protein